MIQLETYAGAPLPVEYVHDWEQGRTTYRTKHGAFVLMAPETRYRDDDPNAVEVQYGIGTRFGHHYAHRAEEPVFYGIPIHGATVARLDGMESARGTLWVNARRLTADFRTESVPDKTRQRVAEVVYALVHHWLSLPEYPTLLHAAEVERAPTRLAELTGMIRKLTEQINELTAKRAEQMRLADIQAVLAAEAVEREPVNA